jgi:hypothetical protein
MIKDITSDEMFFAVFCIENLAKQLNIAGEEAYKLLTEKSSVLDDYIIHGYDSLHTQGKEWIINNLTDYMKSEGIIQ